MMVCGRQKELCCHKLRLTDTVNLVQVNRGAGWGLVRSTEFWVALTGVMFVFCMFYICTKTVCLRRPNVLESLLNMCLVIIETMMRELRSKSIYMSRNDG